MGVILLKMVFETGLRVNFPGSKGVCKNSCVFGKYIFLIRNRYVGFCCRIYDYMVVEYVFLLTVLPCEIILYIILDFFA